jgi:hypothetical protein
MIFVPNEIDEKVELLILQLGLKEKPEFLSCQPTPNSEINECFPNVENQIKKVGGTCVLGWQIWKSTYLIEAEFHAVWQSPEGNLVDITPKKYGINKILFIADPNAVYEGKQINNLRINITDNKLVDQFIEGHNAIFRILNKGERAFQYQIILERRELETRNHIEQALRGLEQMILKGNTRNSPCLCNSGRKYKVCHEKMFNKLITSV